MEKRIKNLIDNSKDIAVFFHINPDGDAIGSALSIKYALMQLNKNVTIFSEYKPPKNLQFLLDENDVCYEVVNKKFDLAIVVDCNEPKRVGKMECVLNNCKNILNIDHHIESNYFKEYRIIDSKASSTCEMLYYFLKELNVEFSKKICLALYVGLACDSGCFMFNITQKLHYIANELVKNIDDVEDINYNLFRVKSFNEVKLYGEAIKKLDVCLNGHLAITDVTLKDFEKTNTGLENTTELVFMLSGLENVDIICVMSEEKAGTYKVSFRSKKIDVGALASLFGGGGHSLASGCKIYGTRNTVKQKIINKVKEYLCME